MFSNLITHKKTLLTLDKFLVLGGGISGDSACLLLNKYGKQVFLADKFAKTRDGVPYSLIFSDTEIEIALSDAQAVVKSPGISPEHPILREAEFRKMPILSEIYLGSLFFSGKIIGITGTDGKSTTTALTHHLMLSKYPNSEVGGNIGLPFTAFCDKIIDIAVLELSSYQLEDSPNIHCTSSAIITLAPDHLERHKTMDRYALAKWKIVDHTNRNHTLVTQSSVLNQIPNSRETFLGKTILIGGKGEVSIDTEGKKIRSENGIYDYSGYSLTGFHNLQNLAFAISLCESVGISNSEIQSKINSFLGLAHRFQLLSTKHWSDDTYKKVKFINDSKATNFHSMLAGIAGFTKSEKIYLILGGEPKDETSKSFFYRWKELDCEVWVYGNAARIWKKEFEANATKDYHLVANIQSALIQIKEKINLEKETSVILSPACASFDQYENFEERGKDFMKLVRDIFDN